MYSEVKKTKNQNLKLYFDFNFTRYLEKKATGLKKRAKRL